MSTEQSQRPVDSDVGQAVSVPQHLEAEASRILGPLAVTSVEEPTESRAGPGLARIPAEETLSFASHVHQYHREYIATADQKAAFVFAVSSTLLVYLYQQSLHLRWMTSLSQWSLSDLVAFVAMAALFLSLAAAAFAVVPRLASSHRGLVFFLSVAEYKSAAEYAASVASETGESLTLAILRHTYDLARIARRKYKALAWAIGANVIGVVLSLALLLFRRSC